MIASRVGLSSGWLPPRRDMRVAAKKANTVAPVSKTGFSARLVQVRLVNWLRVDIANCSLDPVGLLVLTFGNRDTQPAHDDHRHEKSNRSPTDHCCKNRQCLSLQDIEVGNHTYA